MIFITHAVPKNLKVDEVVRIGGEHTTVVGVTRGTNTVADSHGSNSAPKTNPINVESN
jgi:hypothetical protein